MAIDAFPFGQQRELNLNPENKAELIRMLSLILEDARNQGKDKIPLDTTGADYYFIQYFITDEMFLDFDPIEGDFLRNCCDKIQDFAKVKYYEHIDTKLKSEFPDWTYIQPSAYKNLDANGLENKERIFFFTDYLSHITYTKFVAIAREKKIPFSYLHGVNMEQIIRRIYESVG